MPGFCLCSMLRARCFPLYFNCGSVNHLPPSLASSTTLTVLTLDALGHSIAASTASSTS